MKLRSGRIAALAVAALSAQSCVAQEPTMVEHESGITFGTWSAAAGGSQAPFEFGMALPENALTTDSTEYIGLLRCGKSSKGEGGWCGLSHGESGQMIGALLLVAWPHGDEVLTSFRYVTGYDFPGVYKGDAKLTQISSKITDDYYEVTYRCQGCLAWEQDGDAGKTSTSQGFLVLGRASGSDTPTNPDCPDKITHGFHDTGFGQYGAVLQGLARSEYSQWVGLATKTVSGNCGATSPTTTAATMTSAPATTSETSIPATTTTSAPAVTFTPAPTEEFDYIVVGAGAGGITVADKLSEKGHSVLLIEKGPPSTGYWGGTMRPDWLNDTKLTRFDVPGLCNQIWADSAGVACTDMDQMAGCVLGGGVAVNAGLWWKPHPLDWDENFPAGWKSSDTRQATDRVFSRIPGTVRPSQDGRIYYDQGFNVLSSGLSSAGWSRIDEPNSSPDRKNRTFGHSTFMFSGGERGGPLATYLKTAAERSNFRLITDTGVKRLVRSGGRITGVEIEGNPATGHGYSGVVNVTASTGRVILSAGVFGTAKVLFRSGIGPADSLATVKGSASDGASMISESEWINLPVGYNLLDHVNTDTIIDHPDVVFYDFYEAWDHPIPSDEEKYLNSRTGILAQAAPNIGPLFWEEVKGADGIVRQFQWTARVEGTTNTSMTMSMYLGRGLTSRGRMSITSRLDTRVVTPPYLRDDNDRLAVIQALENVRVSLSGVRNLTWHVPTVNQTSEAYVNSLLTTPAQRRANHWMGTTKLGTDDGRNGGTAVVDTNTKVYGTDNLFVVDASIFPGMVTNNPSAMIVIAAEHAATKIMALSQ
ncbi:uncharacterized protein PgNI_03000 [Pyricularia grisea]|uniref:Cellobiose dehydrogenase n=1 Tax=Pyricularia grisea TaxID=148305 RepID=A0A6P8BCC4_PYRGI|nr:uncharacterized protein PgNI_03000 [Pyricularia grisea]TLD13429.1 hypothetical protein PgNI_03000 [Pyricularia grisea]